jgi:DNA-binding beta-propeller fold protein YncE
VDAPFGTLSLAVLMAAVLWIAVPASASADLSFCSPGAGAGQCNKPEGVAVDSSSGRVYVTDGANNRVDVFEADGTFVFAFGWGVDTGAAELQTCTAASECRAGLGGSANGQFHRPRAIAVDNDGASPSQHDVYVFDSLNFRVEKFGPEGNFTLKFGSPGSGEGQFGDGEDPIAVGSGGNVYVGDTRGSESEGLKPRVEKFDEGGTFGEALELGQHGRLKEGGLAVASSGAIYAAFDGAEGIFKYHPNGTEYSAPYPLASGHPFESLAVAPSGDVYAGQTEQKAGPKGGGWHLFAHFDAAGNVVRRFHYEERRSLSGLAFFHSEAGDVYTTEASIFGGESVRYLSSPSPGPLVASLEANAVGNVAATLGAEVNPEGKATKYGIEYVSKKSFDEEGGFASPQTKSSPEEEIANADFALHYVTTQIGCPEPLSEAAEGKCLEPGTTYRFRIVAANADGPGEGEVEGEFTTKPPAEFSATYATEVGTDSARLSAAVNPFEVPATGYFEYVDDASYQESGFAAATEVPDVKNGAAPLEFPSDEGAVTRRVILYPLDQGTAYHYRVVVGNPLGEPVVGPSHTFATFDLPENESCENDAFRSGAAAFLTDCRAYELVSPLEKSNGDIVPLEQPSTHAPAALDQSAVSGEKLAYSSYRAFGDAESAPYISEYIASRSPESGWESHGISPPHGRLLLNVPNQLESEFRAFSPDLCEAWLRTTAEPLQAEKAIKGFPNLYLRHDRECGAESYEALTTAEPGHESPPPFPAQHYVSLELQGVSAAGTHAIYAVTDNLTFDAPDLDAKKLQLYEWVKGQAKPRFVCILPDGSSYEQGCSAGEAADMSGSGQTGRFHNAISADGRRIFWTAATNTSGVGPGRIYVRIAGTKTVAVSKAAEQEAGTNASEYVTAAHDGSKAIFRTGERLYEVDLVEEGGNVVPQTRLIADKVTGVMGTSEDASRIYLVSAEALAPGASEGDSNLYLYDAGEGGGSFRSIGQLAGTDLNTTPSPVAIEPIRRSARVSSDGLHLAFTSFAPLTGYDNLDAESGKPDTEVFLYDATGDGGAGKLICASCNPTGARPQGVNIGESGHEFWAAGQIPGWENALYASRALSDDGSRLYFQSSDVLSPRDSNGTQDVYQWEAEGVGRCSAEIPSYVPASGGCVDLISSGRSPYPADFVDASPDGHDVFFSTLSSLLPQDYGLVDIYDARVDGGFPLEEGTVAQCEGEACQAAPEAPNDPTPASSSFEGSGNVVEPSAIKTHCAKGRVRRRGRCAKKTSRPRHQKRRGAR